MIHTYTGRYIACDEPGCRVQTGGCFECQGGERGPALAHWDWTDDDKQFCPRHRKDVVISLPAAPGAENTTDDHGREG